jgi:hypothetical protein
MTIKYRIKLVQAKKTLSLRCSSYKNNSLRAGRSVDRIPVEEKITVLPDWTQGHHSLSYNWYRVFPGGKAAEK